MLRIFCNNIRSSFHTDCGSDRTSGSNRRVAPWSLALQFCAFVGLLLLMSTCGAQEPTHDPPGLHHFRQAAAGVFLGSEPKGEAAFASLQKLGITTIVSVDSAAPDLVLAKKFGLRYIHIPFGYDGIPEDAARSLSRVARDIHSPVYVHCQHGKHRGPAAAAIVCLAAGSIQREDAVRLMTRAGTSKDYDGLWRDVRKFQPPLASEPLPELVEVAKVESVAAAMAKLDRNFDNLKRSAKAGWRPPADHPDLRPSAEALLVQEGLHECARNLNESHNDEFRVWLQDSEKMAAELYTAVKADEQTSAERLLTSLEQTCTRCHAKYRNR